MTLPARVPEKRSIATTVAAALLGLVAALVLVPAGPARADGWYGGEPRGDVNTVRYNRDYTRCTVTPGPPPGLAKRDLLGLRVVHGRSWVTVTMRVEELRRSFAAGGAITLVTPKWQFTAGAVALIERDQLYLHRARLGAPRRCAGGPVGSVVNCEAATTWGDLQRDVVTFQIPRRCLGNPGWVRAGGSFSSENHDVTGVRTFGFDVSDPSGANRLGGPAVVGPRVRPAT